MNSDSLLPRNAKKALENPKLIIDSGRTIESAKAVL